VRLNLTSPLGIAPPIHVLSKLPLGHVNCAALTHLSQRPFDTLIVLPGLVALNVKRDSLDWPVVCAGLPPHFCIEPAMPPQMPRMATFVSCVSKALRELVRWNVRGYKELTLMCRDTLYR
jgi:hypothetical protein